MFGGGRWTGEGNLLLWCVVTRQIWFIVLDRWRKQEWVPDARSTMEEWWPSLTVGGRKDRRNLNTAVTLVCWSVWKHRNTMVFDGATPSMSQVLRAISQEGDAWCRACLFKGSNLFCDFGFVDVA
ncbi:hypothetical protein BRADI_3g07914v3 [Brachypodium distachyon]|uniref:Reverse transcriptase zinc-binding domain-containing protein n=1 Tax=Brachypodium distachyon TaxID=15368 RepID=A0A2K2CVV4_BRADI|nr:hypothetical protein BRADI_3g07914v3 [Brachypodium distachyon]